MRRWEKTTLEIIIVSWVRLALYNQRIMDIICLLCYATQPLLEHRALWEGVGSNPPRWSDAVWRRAWCQRPIYCDVLNKLCELLHRAVRPSLWKDKIVEFFSVRDKQTKYESNLAEARHIKSNGVEARIFPNSLAKLLLKLVNLN